ncbi:MAG: helix-turn-helix domain-containing protein [Actinobacteria bacterium]|nr:helix-turn-helix domain-containing protein [Actinomycetota bacterium]
MKALLTTDEAADALALSRTMVFNLIRAGELRSVRIGRARRVPVDAINEFVAERLEAQAAEV